MQVNDRRTAAVHDCGHDLHTATARQQMPHSPA